ncbi:hypothetical protein F4559_004655 [Saccharothrix violaceirubra]|uniref:Uncharacterized protein n=1 Tax=Saccharothrix violaceirubra TaxID=413306 RepID=A0A7W7T656_9PSEU|nr:hypothetical protein [Saccharothrix violaceirubra]
MTGRPTGPVAADRSGPTATCLLATVATNPSGPVVEAVAWHGFRGWRR